MHFSFFTLFSDFIIFHVVKWMFLIFHDFQVFAIFNVLQWTFLNFPPFFSFPRHISCPKVCCCARSTGQEERRCYRILLHTFIQSCFFFLHISPLFISPLFISPLFISPLFLYLLFISPLFISPLFLYLPCLYLPRTLGLSLLLYSHPRTAGHTASPSTQLQLIRAAGACLHQNGFASILVQLCSSHDGCGYFRVYEEVRCKS